MHYHYDRFMQAIREKRKVILTHSTNESDSDVTKVCVPLDYRPARHSDYFYVWDPQANVGERLLGLPIWQVKSIEVSEEAFDPSEYIAPNSE
ncbi:MAG: hypothetical protein ACYS8Z_02195 [Planctomycetota bacterium]|jgi:hypothetical protein